MAAVGKVSRQGGGVKGTACGSNITVNITHQLY